MPDDITGRTLSGGAYEWMPAFDLLIADLSEQIPEDALEFVASFLWVKRPEAFANLAKGTLHDHTGATCKMPSSSIRRKKMATESKPTRSVDLADIIAVSKNDPEAKKLEELMVKSARESLTLEEIREQRLSFVMGMLSRSSTMTREEVRSLLKSQYG